MRRGFGIVLILSLLLPLLAAWAGPCAAAGRCVQVRCPMHAMAGMNGRAACCKTQGEAATAPFALHLPPRLTPPRAVRLPAADRHFVPGRPAAGRLLAGFWLLPERPPTRAPHLSV